MYKHPQHILATFSHHYSDRANGFSNYKIKGADIVIAQRYMLESNDNLRQVMPMVMFTCNGQVWAYKRTPKGGEGRLHGKTSVFAGGHFDLDDIVSVDSVIDWEASLTKAVERELEEEVVITSKEVSRKTLPYLVCADNTDVDRKHVAIVTVIELDGHGIHSNEDQLEAIGFCSPDELIESDEFDLETWAELAVKAFANGDM